MGQLFCNRLCRDAARPAFKTLFEYARRSTDTVFQYRLLLRVISCPRTEETFPVYSSLVSSAPVHLSPVDLPRSGCNNSVEWLLTFVIYDTYQTGGGGRGPNQELAIGNHSGRALFSHFGRRDPRQRGSVSPASECRGVIHSGARGAVGGRSDVMHPAARASIKCIPISLDAASCVRLMHAERRNERVRERGFCFRLN